MKYYIVLYYHRGAEQHQTMVIEAESEFRAGRAFYRSWLGNKLGKGAIKNIQLFKVQPHVSQGDLQRFECVNQHVFFLPSEFPLDLMVFVEKLKTMRCPQCYVSTNLISLSAQMYGVFKKE